MYEVQETKLGKNIVSWLPIDTTYPTSDEILSSWRKNSFKFIEENKEENIIGLRPPQIGGIFAALGYERSDSNSSATIVMPTGTGKTEAILSIVVAGQFPKTLILVPSDALREQTKDKFIQLGLLRELGLISSEFYNPRVSTIKSGVLKSDDLNQLLDSNIIISTPNALNSFPDNIIKKLTNSCSHLIVDEAHHVAAKTWARIKTLFTEKSIFQFTATPFRTDSSRVDGKIIFNYPLRKAQLDGYFRPISFHPVKEFVEDKADEKIAERAIELLKEDLSEGLDHIIMARARNIQRAEEVYKHYSSQNDLNPILIHSKSKNIDKIISDIKAKKHRIIVCVSMLGEGFDLPQLKISAIHDPHKSINIMLQFTGRFTRKAENVGDAKFIANIADPKVNENLEDLYTEESDWNSIISNISHEKVKTEKEYQDFNSQFSKYSKLIQLGLTPKVSTTIYKMTLATWKPQSFEKISGKYSQVVDYILNDEKTTLAFSLKTYKSVNWTSSKELYDESWDLYIAHYDQKLGLLFIHSSAKDGQVAKLANIIAPKAIKVQGDTVFRSMSGIKRLMFQNIGLNKNKEGLRYTMHTGTGINDQIPEIEANRAVKSNIFGKGFEDGTPTSIGCSHKGKIWSMDSDTLDHWLSWCKNIGNKILDETINTNTILKTAMRTEILTKFPPNPVLFIQWPVELLRKSESNINICHQDWTEKFTNCELQISDLHKKDESKIFFLLKTPNNEIEIQYKITKSNQAEFKCKDKINIEINNSPTLLTDYLNENPPTLFLSDTSIVDGAMQYIPSTDYSYKYSKEKLESWSWSGVDISKESQREEKYADSIQYYTISKIKEHYDIVFDDDGAGEIADIIAIKNNQNEELIIDLFHCKYCSKKDGIATPGGRIDDVYQVAGQAAKSTSWLSNIENLITRLIDREKNRLSQGKPSRIDKGTLDELIRTAKIARYASYKLGISIVQPAISKVKVSESQLMVIGACSAYIEEVSGIKLRVIINE